VVRYGPGCLGSALDRARAGGLALWVRPARPGEVVSRRVPARPVAPGSSVGVLYGPVPLVFRVARRFGLRVARVPFRRVGGSAVGFVRVVGTRLGVLRNLAADGPDRAAWAGVRVALWVHRAEPLRIAAGTPGWDLPPNWWRRSPGTVASMWSPARAWLPVGWGGTGWRASPITECAELPTRVLAALDRSRCCGSYPGDERAALYQSLGVALDVVCDAVAAGPPGDVPAAWRDWVWPPGLHRDLGAV